MAFLQRYNEQIVKTCAGEGMEIDDVGIDELNQRPDHLARCLAEIFVFLRRLSHHGSGIYRIPAASHLPDVHDRKFGGFRIMSEMIAERAFHAAFAGRHNAFQHDLGVGGHHHVYALCVNHRDTSAAQESRECNFIGILRKRNNRSHHENRVRPDDHGNFQTFSLLFCV